jgi:hypothetical protein
MYNDGEYLQKKLLKNPNKTQIIIIIIILKNTNKA